VPGGLGDGTGAVPPSFLRAEKLCGGWRREICSSTPVSLGFGFLKRDF
jgi:hypothetical protein